MVMNRRHAEDSFSAQLERADLQNDAERFDDENSTDEKEQHFLLDDDGDDTEGAPKRQRADVTHKHFGGMRVVPKKAQGSTDKRTAKNGKFADTRNVLNFEIVRPAVVAADVGEHGERAGS